MEDHLHNQKGRAMKTLIITMMFMIAVSLSFTTDLRADAGNWIDEKRIIIGNETHSVILEAPLFASMQMIPTVSPYIRGVRPGFSVSPDAKFITTGFKAVEVWNINNLSEAYHIPFDEVVQTIVIGFTGSDGEKLALVQKMKGYNYKFLIIHWRTGEVIFEQFFPGSRRLVNREISPDGRYVTFTDSEKVLYVWDDQAGILMKPELRKDHAFIAGIRFSPNSRIAAMGNGTHVDFYTTDGWTPLPVRAEFARTDGGRGGLRPLQFLDDRHVLIHDDNWVYFIFDIETKKYTARYRHRENPSRSFWGRSGTTSAEFRKTFHHAVSSDGSTLVTYPEGLYNLQMFDLKKGLKPVPLCKPGCYGDWPIVLDLKLSPDGKWLFVSTEFGIDFWDLQDLRLLPLKEIKPEVISPSFDITVVGPALPAQQECTDAHDCLEQGEIFEKMSEYERAGMAYATGCKGGDTENCIRQAAVYTRIQQNEEAYEIYEMLCKNKESAECIDGMKKSSKRLPGVNPNRRVTIDTDRWCREDNLHLLEKEMEAVRFYRGGDFIGLKITAVTDQLSKMLQIRSGSIITNSIGCIEKFCNLEEYIKTLRSRCQQASQVSIRTFDPETETEVLFYYQK